MAERYGNIKTKLVDSSELVPVDIHIECIDDKVYAGSEMPDDIDISTITWNLCKTKMPIEHDSYFLKFYDTDVWTELMWKKESDRVLVICELEDGRKELNVAVTHDGKWYYGPNSEDRKTLTWAHVDIPNIISNL